MVCSAEGRILCAGGGNLLLEAVADRQQLLFVDHVLATRLEVVLVDVGLHDRVDRAGFLAEPAEYALEQIDIVARGATAAIGTLLGIDGDRQRRANRLAQLAGDAALLAIGIAAQGVQPRKRFDCGVFSTG